MNRLVIIGNGFDLAHGLPTSYRDFIDDFWKNFKEKLKTEEYNKFVSIHDSYDKYYSAYGEINNFIDFKNSIKECIKEHPGYDFDEHQIRFFTSKFGNRETIFQFKNDFFKLINQKNAENWVDIENEYYKILKKNIDSKPYIEKLNLEFEDVKDLLERYLNDKILDGFKLGLFPDPSGDIFKFKDIIKPISLFSNEDKLLDEFPSDNHDEIKEQFDYEVQGVKSNTKLFFLDFNYTPTIYRYLINGKYNDDIETFVNFIHGEVGNDKHNKINFGFGDEMDDDYKMIENINDNEYLKNFKSFQYLQNSNYKMLLDFVETEKYQIYIMGHSCGLSDRTLLNTIFEHHNCRSIKIFYHQKKDGTDNYTEITQNISRHFNKKKLMREKIVNKTLCQPLPQIQLPKKEKRVNF